MKKMERNFFSVFDEKEQKCFRNKDWLIDLTLIFDINKDILFHFVPVFEISSYTDFDD